MVSDSQKKAKAKYLREKVKQINLKFYPADAELYEKARKMGASEIKKLIAKA